MGALPPPPSFTADDARHIFRPCRLIKSSIVIPAKAGILLRIHSNLQFIVCYSAASTNIKKQTDFQ